MKQRLAIILCLGAMLIGAAGCASKKKINPSATPISGTEQDAAREAAEQRLRDSIALAEQARLQAIEQQRIQDSIAAAEEAKREQVQTMSISRMTVSVTMGGQQMSVPATMRWQRGKGAIVSILPLAGIEMFRAELTDGQLTIIDKMNMRYTRLTDSDLRKQGIRTSLADVDAWIDDNILAHRDEPQLTMKVNQAGVNASIVIYTAGIQTDKSVNIRPMSVDGYRKVTLEQMMKLQ